MAELVAGLSCSHAPSIAHVYDKQRTEDPGWQPLFEALEAARQWLSAQRPDVLVVIYNDHVDQYFLDAWPTFTIGTGAAFDIADEGWGPREFPPVPGAPELSRHIAGSLVADGFDLAVSHEQVVDHGVLAPLPLINRDWAYPIVPMTINVIFEPRPSPRRCWDLGEHLGAAIRGHDSDLRVAVVGTGGLSHHLWGPTFGQVDADWDREFLRLMADDPLRLADMTLSDFAKLGGAESVEVVQWLAMRGALGDGASADFCFYYPYQVMGYGGMGFVPAAGAG